MFFDQQFQHMILCSVVNLDRKSECYVIQIQLLMFAAVFEYPLQATVPGKHFSKINARKENVNVLVGYSNMKPETALKSV